MLSYLLRQLIRSFGIFFRTIRAFFTRKLAGAGAYIRRVTNFSRQATKVANASFQGAAAAMKKPTKREDYIETERLFVSKSFLVMLAVGLLLLILAGYFILWPLLLSRFFTAHFYQEDKRVEDWSGKVVVYYDEEKEIPRYSGRLKEGVLQGRGSQYDEAGLLIYEGDFADGVRSGTGTLYDAGVLTYEGDFAYGLRHGNGTDYSATGDVAYRGAFVEDVREGMGTAYYPDGERAYEGAFAAGLYDGTGTQYGEDGQIRYKGSFAEGLYNGSGTLYLPDGDQIQAEFVDGHTDGTIRWYQEGKLWYDGSADDLTPDGFGTIYAENGKVIYAGEMDRGTLDGAWLLGLTAEDLRAAFGEAALEESDGARGFRVRNGELGLTALCSYQTEEEEARPYQLWLAPRRDSLSAELLPWADRTEAARWATEDRDPAPETEAFSHRLSAGQTGGSWRDLRYVYGDLYTCALISGGRGSAPEEILWSRVPGQSDLREEPVVDEETEGAEQAQERLDQLMAALGGLGGEETDAADGQEDQDLGDVERMVGLMLTAADAGKLVDALTDYYVYGEMAAALELSQPLLEQELAQAQTQLERGKGDQAAVDGAQEALDTLDRRLMEVETAREQAKLTIQSLSKLEPDDYKLQDILVDFDPVDLSVSNLSAAAVKYAEAAAAGEQVDRSALELEIKSLVLELGMDYEAVRAGRKTVERAAASLEEVTAAYARGSADKAALYSAQRARNDAAAALCQAVGNFTHRANRLNTLSGGWIAQEYDWMADTFATIFQSEIIRSQESAKEKEKDREDRETEAAGAIVEEAEPPAPTDGEQPAD